MTIGLVPVIGIPSGVKMPILNPAFFSENVLPEVSQSQYLVAIGLAVN